MLLRKHARANTVHIRRCADEQAQQAYETLQIEEGGLHSKTPQVNGEITPGEDAQVAQAKIGLTILVDGNQSTAMCDLTA